MQPKIINKYACTHTTTHMQTHTHTHTHTKIQAILLISELHMKVCLLVLVLKELLQV